MNKKIMCLMLVAVLGNCAFPATREGMKVGDFKSPNKVGDKIFVEQSTGGSTTLPFWKSKISDENFTLAVKDSIIDANLFEKIEETLGDNWNLKIEIVEVDQPHFGTTFKVNTKVKYTLRKKDEIIKETLIDVAGEATMSDAFVGVVRLRLANENAARANIRKFLEEISTITPVKKKK